MCSNGRVDLKGRILAIDYGTRNIGLACSDELHLTVQPLPSIPNSGKKEFVRKVRDLVLSMDVRELILGMPINMDGSSGDAVARMEQIRDLLQREFDLPLTGVDERLSTVEAAELWREMSPRRQKRYRTIDSLAAALILERRLRGD